MKKLKILVLMGGPSEEHEVSLKTGAVICENLNTRKYDIKSFVVPKQGPWEIPRNVDLAFIAMHGTFGEDGTVQAFLESQKIPYTGSGVLASALAMDKVKSNQLFAHHGLNVPRFFNFGKAEWKKGQEKMLNGSEIPCVVKPIALGSSVGVTPVKKRSDLQEAVKKAFSKTDHIMIQEYIAGTEVTCGVLDEGGGKGPIALPPTQIIPKTSSFFDYNAKYTPCASEEITPPRLPKKIVKEIQTTALKAHEILGCAGLSRTDMIVRGGKIFILETNTIPGMTETSLYPQAARAAGISFQGLLDKLIQAGFRRYN